jgi:predicted tellurium resistance membrane protein TerC
MITHSLNYHCNHVLSCNRYLLEQSLSVDNLFVFVLVFKYFKVPKEYQVCLMAIVAVKVQIYFVPFLTISDIWNKNRVLSYGIAGAVVFRAVMIVLGVAAIEVNYSLMLTLVIIFLPYYMNCYNIFMFCRNLRRWICYWPWSYYSLLTR